MIYKKKKGIRTAQCASSCQSLLAFSDGYPELRLQKKKIIKIKTVTSRFKKQFAIYHNKIPYKNRSPYDLMYLEPKDTTNT